MMTLDVEQFRVAPGEHLAIREIDANQPAKDDDVDRAEIERGTAEAISEMHDWQQRLFAEKQQSLLVVLLAIDTGGKDSTVRRVFGTLNPQGCRVTGFGVPTPQERAHDFLWRIHQQTPQAGMIGIFNRSHYEDVVVPRVHDELSTAQLVRRCEHIQHFEQLLIDSGTSILKFHLRISADEQRERLEDRLNDPEKHWKFDPGDLEERTRWDAYQDAFATAIAATSTSDATWYIVPANRKWFRDAIIARVVRDKFRQMNPQFPPPVEGIERYEVPVLSDER
jgi:PPK2 family polyphosphate:nucleotide phosphotransferase